MRLKVYVYTLFATVDLKVVGRLQSVSESMEGVTWVAVFQGVQHGD